MEHENLNTAEKHKVQNSLAHLFNIESKLTVRVVSSLQENATVKWKDSNSVF